MKKFRVCYVLLFIGYLYIGNVRIVLFNYLFVCYYGGDFIIRIEDIDVVRNVEGGIIF